MSAPQEDDAAERSHEPTPRRLEEARRRGQVPRSQDVTAAAAAGGFVLACLLFGAESVARSGTALALLLGQADLLAEGMMEGASAAAAPLLRTLAAAFAPFALLPAAAALLAVLAQQAFTVTGENLAPKLSRISPLAQAKQKFGLAGLVEFAKSTAKLCLVTLALGWFLAGEAEAILGLARLEAGPASAEMGRLLVGFSVAVVAVSALVAAADWLWQRHDHLRSNRMTHRELLDEMRESEGDPWLRSERRRRGRDIATNRMLADVPKADVVIVNPTHYAVALAWSRKPGAAPVCLAKGVDEIAARIREAAAEAGVPIHRDPPTARILYATLEPGREIRPEEYRAVAAAIRFAERMRAEARARRR